MIDTLGAIGGAMLALCAVPQAAKVNREGHAHGLSWAFLTLWGGGEALLLAYTLARYPGDWRLILNYAVNVALVGFIVWRKVRPLVP